MLKRVKSVPWRERLRRRLPDHDLVPHAAVALGDRPRVRAPELGELLLELCHACLQARQRLLERERRWGELCAVWRLRLEALTGDKISVGPPYFDTVFVPLMTPLVFLMGVGPLARWKQAELPDLAVIDVSFISLRHVIPATLALTTRPADLIALIKPQFEAGRAELDDKQEISSIP